MIDSSHVTAFDIIHDNSSNSKLIIFGKSHLILAKTSSFEFWDIIVNYVKYGHVTISKQFGHLKVPPYKTNIALLTFSVDKYTHNRLTERNLDCFVEIIIIIDWK